MQSGGEEDGTAHIARDADHSVRDCEAASIPVLDDVPIRIVMAVAVVATTGRCATAARCGSE